MENQNIITKRKNECWAGEDNRCSLQYGVGKDIVLLGPRNSTTKYRADSFYRCTYFKLAKSKYIKQ